MALPLPGPESGPADTIVPAGVRRTRGRCGPRRWSAVGRAGVLGLTTVSAGLAYDITPTPSRRFVRA